MTTPRSKALAIAIAIGVVLVAATAAALLTTGDDGEPVDRALDVLGQEQKFDSSREAVVHFADVYQHLVDATAAFPKDCDVDTAKGRCLALNQAASWSLNFSTASGSCTQPAVQEGRIAILDYLTTTTNLDDAATEPPPLPPLPAC